MSNTGAFSAIGALITAVKNSNIDRAKERCKAAKKEFDNIRGKINVPDRKKVECVDEFIDDVLNGRQQGVTERVNIAWKTILNFYTEENRKSTTGQSKTGTDARGPENKDAEQRYNSVNETNVPVSNPGTSVVRQDRVKNTLDDENPLPEPITKRGIIAVATEFHDLYETEWILAYEELDEKIQEREKVQILLEIVQKAFDYNKAKGKQLYEDAETEAKRAVAGNGFKKDKMIDFLTKWEEHLRKSRVDFRIKDDFVKYVHKCVRVTWLLCIEDPPIHMDYGKDGKSGKPGVFDKDKYIPYSRGGPTIDYIVWPALMNKNMDGEVLMKGMAQGK